MEAVNMTVSTDDLYNIYSTVLWLGAAAPNFANVTTGKLLSLVTEQYMQFPNTSVEDLSQFLGCTPETGNALVDTFGGPDNAPMIIAYANSLMPFVPHPRNTTIVIPLFLVFTVISTVIVGLRFFSRHQVAKSIQSSDWMMVVGTLTTFVWGALAVWHSILEGPWSAFYDNTYGNHLQAQKYYFILMALYPMAMFAIKASLLLFYYRMSTNAKYLKWATIGTGVILSGNTLGSFFAWLFRCGQVDSWNNPFTSTCNVNAEILALSTGAINIATDLMIWAMPMPLVWRLQLYPRERILAAVTFSLGGVACVASCFRLVSIKAHIKYSGTSSSNLMIDAWTIIELNLAIICASAPAIRALIVHYAPKIFNMSTRKATTNNSSMASGVTASGLRTPPPSFPSAPAYKKEIRVNTEFHFDEEKASPHDMV